MTDITIPQELSDVDKLIYLVRVSDKADSLTREGLYKVFTEEGWKGRFSSWGEFVSSPDGLNKSEGWASKHLNVYRHYTLEGGISQEKLSGIPTESLYLARTIPGSYEKQVQNAKSLSRQALKQKKNDEEAEMHEPKWVTYCSVCGLSQTNHP